MMRLCLMIGLGLSAFAQSLQFVDFSDTSNLSLNGDAEVVATGDGSVLRIVEAFPLRVGSAFSALPIAAGTFSTAFSFRLTNPLGGQTACNLEVGGDGFAFVVQGQSAVSLGNGGFGLGYEGITESVAVEFDFYCNTETNDPDSNHIGILTNGVVVHNEGLPETTSIPTSFTDGNRWFAWIEYDGERLEVRVNQSGTRPQNADLSQELDLSDVLGEDTAYVGFTAATGGSAANQDIVTWSYDGQELVQLVSLQPPLFIDQHDVWLEDNGDLSIRLPDPGLDGLSSANGLQYSITLTDINRGDDLLGPQMVTGGSWPQSLTISAANLPAEAYHIGIARHDAAATKAAVRDARLYLVAPIAVTISNPNAIDSYERWLLHLPRQAGGFFGALDLFNTHPSSSTRVRLQGFDVDGNALAAEFVDLAPGQRVRRDLYAMDGVFPASDLFDRVSHIGIHETGQKTKVALQYRSAISDYGVWVDEVRLDSGSINGDVILMDGASPNDAYWDGIAVLNLLGERATNVEILRFNGGAQTGSFQMGSLAPGAKRLAVLSSAFGAFQAGARYEIRSDQGVIQVLGLSGILSGEFFTPVRLITP